MLNCYKQEALTIALRQEGSPESLWPRSLAGANQSHSTGFRGTALITSERAPAHIALVERTSDSNGRLGGGGKCFIVQLNVSHRSEKSPL